jgi:hypothetical protein
MNKVTKAELDQLKTQIQQKINPSGKQDIKFRHFSAVKL